MIICNETKFLKDFINNNLKPNNKMIFIKIIIIIVNFKSLIYRFYYKKKKCFKN